jgi:hypothetical protein
MTSAYKNIDFGEKGICKGVYYGQNERVDELNGRIQTRHFPDVALPPNFDPRPLSTKFSLFPIFIRNQDGSATKNSSSIKQTKGVTINDDETNQTVVYNPGTDRGPPITFLRNIHIENQLRKEYIPGTNSDLYGSLSQIAPGKASTTLRPDDKPSTPSKNEIYTTYIPTYLASPYSQSGAIGGEKLNNFTKVQLRNINS